MEKDAPATGAAALDVVGEEEYLAEPGLCKANDIEELETFTVAQYGELNWIINSSLMQTLDTFTDLIIGKVIH